MGIEPSQLIDQDGSQNEPSGRHKAAARPPFAAGGGSSPGTVVGLPRFAAEVVGLGHLVAPEHVRSTVSAIFDNNFKSRPILAILHDETGQPWVGCPVEPGDERSEAPTPLT